MGSPPPQRSARPPHAPDAHPQRGEASSAPGRELDSAPLDLGEEPELSAAERVYRGILRGLYEGRYAPGQRLVEPDLMRHFSVGRGTIREAFSRLSAAGIVELVRHRGATVLMLSRRQVNELLDVIGALFGLAARVAAEKVRNNPAAQRALLEAYERIRPYEWKDDFAGFAEERERFYRTVIQISGNREITDLFPTMKVHIMRIQLRPFQHAADALQIADYHAVTEAILSGDQSRAEAVARAHVRHTADRVVHVPDRAFDDRDAH